MIYEEFIPWSEVRKHLKCKPQVWARILRLNDHRGLKPYMWPRGYRRTTRPINMDVLGPKEFIAKFGQDAYRAVPRSALFRKGHRKFISQEYIVNAGLK